MRRRRAIRLSGSIEYGKGTEVKKGSVSYVYIQVHIVIKFVVSVYLISSDA